LTAPLDQRTIDSDRLSGSVIVVIPAASVVAGFFPSNLQVKRLRTQESPSSWIM